MAQPSHVHPADRWAADPRAQTGLSQLRSRHANIHGVTVAKRRAYIYGTDGDIDPLPHTLTRPVWLYSVGRSFHARCPFCPGELGEAKQSKATAVELCCCCSQTGGARLRRSGERRCRPAANSWRWRPCTQERSVRGYGSTFHGARVTAHTA